MAGHRIDGKTMKLSQIEVSLMQLLKKATTGDVKSIVRALELAKELDRRAEERANVGNASAGTEPLTDSDRAMIAHFVRSDLLDERFAPEDAEAAMKVFGIFDDQDINLIRSPTY